MHPDWVCEVLSPVSARPDRTRKREIYARAGVGHYWIADPAERTLEAYALGPEGRWVLEGAWGDDATARIRPFEAVEIPVGRLILPKRET